MNTHVRRVVLFALVLVAASLVKVDVPSLSALSPAPCADLVITGFEISPLEPVQGQNATIDITVKNQGTCKSLSFVVQWKSDQYAPTGPSTYVGGLYANQSKKVTFEYAFPEAGNYTTVAIADSDNTAPETNENNNLEILPVTVQPYAPDLVITDLVIVPSEPVQGITAHIYVRVKNQGNAPAGPFVVQWKSDRYAPTGPSTQLNGLGAGKTRLLDFEYAFPDAGDFTTVASVDTDNDVAESNEDNNLAIQSVTVREAAPDLVITDFTIVPVKPAKNFPPLPVEGLNARIDITVLNQGNAPAGSFVVQWKSALTAPTGPSSHVSGLAAGSSCTVSFEYAFPNAGNFTTVAIVDSDDTVDEFNESNNLEILSTTVQEAVIDLVLTGFTVEPAPGVPASIPPLPVQGRLTRITIVVENQGNYPAGDFKVEWMPKFLAQALLTQVGGLEYDDETTVIFDYTYTSAGTFFTTATVDSTNTVRESDEDNNSQTKLVTVEPPLPDLEILVFRFDPVQPVAGTEATAIIRIRNRGNTPAGEFLVRWRPTPLAAALSTQVNGLGVGDSTVVRFTHTYPFPGEFTTMVEVDSDDRVSELDEDNNVWTRQVVVQRATRDLVITDFQIVPDDGESTGCTMPDGDDPPPLVEPVLEQGAEAKICIMVQNLGNSALGPFVVEWNPDAFGLITPSPATLSTQVDNLGAGQETQVVFNFVYPEAGEFRTVAKVDAFDDIVETNEDNNLAIRNVVVTPSGPNLVITDMMIGNNYIARPKQPEGCESYFIDPQAATAINGIEPVLEQGRRALVCIEVENQGNRSAGPFVVEWNPDAFGLITPSPGTVSKQVDSLNVGQSKLVIFKFTYNEAGNFHTVAEVDAFDDVVELDEADNLAVLDVVVEAAGPDLVITDLTIEPVSTGPVNAQDEQVTGEEPVLVQGEEAIVAITVYNQGNRSADSFIVEWNPDAYGLITPSPGTLSSQIDGLGVGQSAQVEFHFTYHQHGGFRTVAKVDAFNALEELNEANNLKVQNVVVEPARIDLRITSFTISPPSPVRGSKAIAYIKVRNDGNYPTGSFWVQWKPTGEDAGTGPRIRVDGLHPNKSTTVQLESTFRIAGSYTSWAMADVYDQVIETNENNNVGFRPVNVQPRETTILLENLKIDVVNAKGDCEYILDGDWTDCDGEWGGAFAVVDPAAADKLRYDDFYDGGVENDTVISGGPLEVTLVESFPLILGAAAIEIDVASGNEELGYALAVWSAADYMGVGSRTIQGEEGVCSGGRCFDLKYTITIKEKPPVPYMGENVALLPPESVELPPNLSRLIPEDAELPENVVRAPVPYDTGVLAGPTDAVSIVYLPVIQR